MDEQMYDDDDDDADLIEQVSDDDDGDEMETEDKNGRGKNNRRSGSRLSEQVNMEDEPALQGYERTDMIGQGAYGIVYKGKKEETGDIVAIKRIPFADSTPEGGVPCNVIREISLLRELDHPNVVSCTREALPAFVSDAFSSHKHIRRFCIFRSNSTTLFKPILVVCIWSLNMSHTI
jgi:serine/threonine protein kinase